MISYVCMIIVLMSYVGYRIYESIGDFTGLFVSILDLNNVMHEMKRNGA